MPPVAEIATLSPAVALKRVRIESIDVVRGFIMIVMALDHTRDFFGNSGLNPTDPATTTVPLFFTRWITHFCAPVFFLLTGTGAWLGGRRKSKGELSRFVEEAVQARILELETEQAKRENAGVSSEAIDGAIDEALEWARRA